MKLEQILLQNESIIASKREYITREVLSDINDKINDDKSIILTGLRQVGKTTILHQLRKSNDNSVYMTIRDKDSKEELENIINALFYRYDKKLFLIDEIQNVNDWGNWIIDIYNQFPEATFVISGSASISTRNTTGSARFRDVQVLPFSIDEYREFSKLKNVFIDEDSIFEKWAGKNAIPSFSNEKINNKDVKETYFNSYVYRDILKYEGNIDLNIVTSIIDKMSSNSSGEFNLSEIAESILGDKTSYSRSLIKSYFDLLERYNLIKALDRKNIEGSTMRTKKYYFNPHVYLIINECKFEELPNEKRGYFLESLVVFYCFKFESKHFIKQTNNSSKYPKQEVDLVVGKNWYEIKATDTVQKATKQLNKMFKEFNSQDVKTKSIVYLGPDLLTKSYDFINIKTLMKNNKYSYNKDTTKGRKMTLKQSYLARAYYNIDQWEPIKRTLLELPEEQLNKEIIVSAAGRLQPGSIKKIAGHIVLAGAFIYRNVVASGRADELSKFLLNYPITGMLPHESKPLQEILDEVDQLNRDTITLIESYDFDNGYGDNELTEEGRFKFNYQNSSLVQMEHLISHFNTHAAGITQLLLQLGVGEDASMYKKYFF